MGIVIFQTWKEKSSDGSNRSSTYILLDSSDNLAVPAGTGTGNNRQPEESILDSCVNIAKKFLKRLKP